MSVDIIGDQPHRVSQEIHLSTAPEPKYLTQRQLAERWHVSQGTIINWRNTGKIDYFNLPGTHKILYPLKDIKRLEEQHTTNVKEATKTQADSKKLRKKKPVVSDKPTKVWRV